MILASVDFLGKLIFLASVVDQYKYLGIVLDTELSDDKDI